MIFVKLFSPLAWTWYVLVGTLVTYAIGIFASAVTTGSDGGRPEFEIAARK
jgi:hypothetical protein